MINPPALDGRVDYDFFLLRRDAAAIECCAT